jgi:hypothetical protein
MVYKLHKDRKADAIANLYRAIYCLAIGDNSTADLLLKKSLPYFNYDEKKQIDWILKHYNNNKIAAEKLCDLYLTMKTF